MTRDGAFAIGSGSRRTLSGPSSGARARFHRRPREILHPVKPQRQTPVLPSQPESLAIQVLFSKRVRWYSQRSSHALSFARVVCRTRCVSHALCVTRVVCSGTRQQSDRLPDYQRPSCSHSIVRKDIANATPIGVRTGGQAVMSIGTWWRPVSSPTPGCSIWVVGAAA